MATIFFGDEADEGYYPNNGNWRDINQWYANRGSYGKQGWSVGPLLNRFPTTSDVVVCDQSVLSGVGVYNTATSSWSTDNTWPGSVVALKTGYYTGNPFDNNTGVGIWTGMLGTGMTIYGTSAAPIIAGPLVYFISNHQGYSNGSNAFQGGVITRGYTSSGLNNITTRIGGNARWNSTSSLQSANIYIGGRATVSATSISVGPGGEIYLYSQSNSTYNFSISSAGTVYLFKGTFSGPLTLTTGAQLVLGPMTIAADISTAAVGGCTNYTFLGTPVLTNSANLVLGRPNTYANILFNQLEFYDASTPPQNSSIGSSACGVARSLTIYGRPTSNGFTNGFYYTRITSSVLTGTLTLIPITGFSSVMIGIGSQSVYAPTTSVLVTTSGTSTRILTANWPADYGFIFQATFRPNVQLTGLPAGTDVLSSQLI